MKHKVHICLDKRSLLQSGKYPVKLHVSFRVSGSDEKARRVHDYYTIAQASVSEFNAATGKRQYTREQEKLAETISKSRNKAQKILDDNHIMSPGLFARLYTGSSGDTVGSLFDRYIAELREYDRVGTASSYQTALESLKKFAGGDFNFIEVSVDWLRRYERWMKGHKVSKEVGGKIVEETVSKSTTTIGIYLRCLRKIFNDAIQAKIIGADYYPFGRRQFVIQSVQAPKHALSEEQKNAVLRYDGKEREAVDFWIFSYFCNGMNFTDICQLRHRDIQDDMIMLDRAKIRRTSRVLKKIEIPLGEEAREIIRKYGSRSLSPSAFVFNILQPGLTAQQEKYRIQDFIDRVNISLRRVASDLGFSFKFTTYTARHTYATILEQQGVPRSFIKNALGHASGQTTDNYMGGFDRETKRAMNEKLRAKQAGVS